MLSRITAVTLSTHYPDNILIDAGADPETGKFAGYCYLLDGEGNIHRLLLSTTAIFDDKAAATNYFKELALELQTTNF